MLSQHSQHCCQQCRAHTNFSAWYFQIIGSLSLSLSRSRTLLAHALTHALSLTQRTHATSGKVGGGHAWHTLTGVSFCTFERSLLRTNVPILTPAARTALPSTLSHTHIQTHTHTHTQSSASSSTLHPLTSATSTSSSGSRVPPPAAADSPRVEDN